MVTRIGVACALASLLFAPGVTQNLVARISFPAEPENAAAGPSPFSIAVEQTRSGIALTCTHGCAWKTTTAKSPVGVYRITDDGIEPLGSVARPDPSRKPQSGFAITVDTSGKGIRATCSYGCTWTAVSAAYPSSGYRLTKSGIEPAR